MNALERQVLHLIGEDADSPDVFTDDSTGMAQIRDSINDAIEEIQILTGGYRQTYHLPLREGQTFYRVDVTRGHFAWVTDAWLVGNQWRLEQTDVHRLNAHDPRWMVHAGSPEAYFQVGADVIGVAPRPSGSSDVIEFTAVVVPERYTADTDRIKLRDEYQRTVVHYAVSEFWASRGDAKEAMGHHERYMAALGLKGMYPQSGEASRLLRTHKDPWPKNTS